jgi:hypothetical protein
LFNHLNEDVKIDLAMAHPAVAVRETKCYKYILSGTEFLCGISNQ